MRPQDVPHSLADDECAVGNLDLITHDFSLFAAVLHLHHVVEHRVVKGFPIEDFRCKIDGENGDRHIKKIGELRRGFDEKDRCGQRGAHGAAHKGYEQKSGQISDGALLFQNIENDAAPAVKAVE